VADSPRVDQDTDAHAQGRAALAPGWTSPGEPQQGPASWIDWHIHHYFLSALGYKTPSQWERDYQPRHVTQPAAA